MRYLLLIYNNERAIEGIPQEQMAAELDKWYGYTDALQKSGAWLGGEALQPTSTATTVRVEREKTLTIDGPFAETKEQLGGFYMIEASDLDVAVEWAAKMPHMTQGGTVEVRPIMEFPSR